MKPAEESKPPNVPEDLSVATKAGRVRAPTHVVSTICDDRGGWEGALSFKSFKGMVMYVSTGQSILTLHIELTTDCLFVYICTSFLHLSVFYTCMCVCMFVCLYRGAGEEPTYAGVPMSTIIEKDYGVGDVISLLWFKRSLPAYCTKFIEVPPIPPPPHSPTLPPSHPSPPPLHSHPYPHPFHFPSHPPPSPVCRCVWCCVRTTARACLAPTTVS